MTKTLPKPRKKSPRTTGAPRATKKTSERLKELWATPGFREKMKQRDQARIAAAKHNPTRFSRYGIPDGMRRAEAEPLWARANELADRFIAALKRNGEIPDDTTEVVAGDGSIYISVTADGMAEAALREAFMNAGGLAWSERTELLVCVSGRGVCSVDANGKVRNWPGTAEGEPICCPNAVAVAGDGTVFLVDGSRHNTSDQWLPDLMQKRSPSGRLITCDATLANARVLAAGLEWPSGVAVAHDEQNVLVSESWPHRLSAFARSGNDRRTLVKNFTGYLARIVRGISQDYWMAFFALRTQLTEFMLRENAFRTRMMANVPQHLWVGPTLGGTFDYREPTQIGRIKKLGIQKPWAPPRSYGLVARLDAGGHAIESFHSRASGNCHGVTSVALGQDRVLVASKGHGKIAELPAASAADGKRT